MPAREPPDPKPEIRDSATAGGRQQSPSASRNREPIFTVLTKVLPVGAKVLEVASGTGEHAAYFAKMRPDVGWKPSDPDEAARASIAAWIRAERLPNVAPPIALDAASSVWRVEAEAPFDAVVAINMIHIAPWAACQGLIAGAARILGPNGVLVLYGPFKRGGLHTAPSNAGFDENLKARNPTWGVRDLDDVAREAAAKKFRLEQIAEMPANNLTVVFRR